MKKDPNLFSEEKLIQPERHRSFRIPLFILVAPLLILLELLVLWTMNQKVEYQLLLQHQKKQELQTELLKLGREIQSQKAVIPVIPPVILPPEGGKVLQILRSLTANVPNEAWLTHLFHKEGQLHIEGWAFSNEIVSEFMLKLKNSGLFDAVDLIFSQEEEEKDSLQKFQLICRLKT